MNKCEIAAKLLLSIFMLFTYIESPKSNVLIDIYKRFKIHMIHKLLILSSQLIQNQIVTHTHTQPPPPHTHTKRIQNKMVHKTGKEAWTRIFSWGEGVVVRGRCCLRRGGGAPTPKPLLKGERRTSRLHSLSYLHICACHEDVSYLLNHFEKAETRDIVFENISQNQRRLVVFQTVPCSI